MQAVLYSQPRQFFSSDLADAMQLAHGQRRNKVLHLIRGDHKQSIGLFPVAGDLGQELVRRHPRRNRDMQLIGDPPTDILGNTRGAAAEMRAIGNIQIGFVQRQRFDQIGVFTENRVDFFRCFFIGIHTRLDDGQVGAQFQRMARGHGRPHAVGPRLVIAGGDHPAPVRRATYRQGLLRQARVIPHFDGSVEAVTVDVDDFALRHIKRGVIRT